MRICLKQMVIASVLSAGLGLGGCQNTNSLQSALDLGVQVASAAGYGLPQSGVASAGLKDLLLLSSERAGTFLSKQEVWNLLLPDSASRMVDTLRSVGLGRYVDDVQDSMETAAASAAKEAKPIFASAVRDLSVTDAMGILRGGEDAATQYFRNKTQTALRARLQPVVQSSLQKSGYYNQYQSLLGVYNAIPLVRKPNLNLESYVLDKTLDGMYQKMAVEEALIRKNPAARGTALVQTALSALQ